MPIKLEKRPDLMFTKKRVVLFDELRGLMIISMVLYHLCYDLVVLFGVDIDWYFKTPGILWQQSICFTFIFISGACCSFSNSNPSRAFKLLGFAALFTIVTYIAMPEMLIVFGLLHFLGISILLVALFKGLLEKVRPIVGISIFIVLFILTYHLPDGYLGILYNNQHGTLTPLLAVKLPEFLYSSKYLFMLGLPDPTFHSSDYFPLIPYFFLFIAGSYVGKLGERSFFPYWMYDSHIRVLAFLGKNSLWIYLLHQPIVYGILTVIKLIMGS